MARLTRGRLLSDTCRVLRAAFGEERAEEMLRALETLRCEKVWVMTVDNPDGDYRVGNATIYATEARAYEEAWSVIVDYWTEEVVPDRFPEASELAARGEYQRALRSYVQAIDRGVFVQIDEQFVIGTPTEPDRSSGGTAAVVAAAAGALAALALKKSGGA